jgi:DNA uptake protein ComE-like DNA-binding protein
MLRLFSTFMTIAFLLLGCASAPQPPTTVSTIEANTARPAEFDKVVGLGPYLADRIVKARSVKTFGGCGDLIARVPGIGLLAAKKFSESGLRVNGESC